MNTLKKLYCRTFQTVFKLAIPLLPYHSPKRLGSMEELVKKLKELKLNSVLLVTDKGIRSLGLTGHLEELLTQNNISCAVYDGTVANPTTDNVGEALSLYRQNGLRQGSRRMYRTSAHTTHENERNTKSAPPTSASFCGADHSRNRQ